MCYDIHYNDTKHNDIVHNDTQIYYNIKNAIPSITTRTITSFLQHLNV